MLIWASEFMFAQDMPFVSQYFDLQSLYNPAATGVTGTLKIALDGRIDSVGSVDKTENLSALAEGGYDFGNLRIGGGLKFTGVKRTPDNMMRGALNLSLGYRIGNGFLSFGLSPGIIRGKIGQNGSSDSGNENSGNEDENQEVANKESYDYKRINATSFDIGIGLLFSYKDLWISASGLHLTNPKFTIKRTGYVEDENDNYSYVTREAAQRTFYFGGGYNITVKKSLWYVEPSFMLSAMKPSTQWQATVRLKFRNLFFAGIGWRSKKTGTIIAGIEYKGFHLSYSYDHGFSSAPDGYKYGGHELLAWYSVTFDVIKQKKYRQKSVRIL